MPDEVVEIPARVVQIAKINHYCTELTVLIEEKTQITFEPEENKAKIEPHSKNVYVIGDLVQESEAQQMKLVMKKVNGINESVSLIGSRGFAVGEKSN